MTGFRCGSRQGYRDHLRAGQPTCTACRASWREYNLAREAERGTCRFPGCDENVRAQGFCGTHVSRIHRTGTVADSVAPSAADRFWPLVRVGAVPMFAPALGPCLIWTGAVGTKGYGKFSVARGELWLAHRWLWTTDIGPISDATPELDHLCRVRLCVRTRHLEPVTRAENLRREHEARRAAA